VAGQVEHEDHADGFFWNWRCCASWILTSRVNSESLVLSQIAETPKRNCKEKKTSVVEKQLLGPPSWQCASSCNATDSWLLANTNTTVLPQPPYSLTWLRKTSYFQTWNPLWKDDFRWFKRWWKIRRRSYTRSRNRRTRTASRSGYSVGSGASMQEGSILNVILLTRLHACPKKITKKKSSETFWTDHTTWNSILKVTVLWDVMSRSLVAIYWHLGETCSSIIRVKVKVVRIWSGYTCKLKESQSVRYAKREERHNLVWANRNGEHWLVAYFMIMSVPQTMQRWMAWLLWIMILYFNILVALCNTT
jgi:hypothetical protein